MPIFYLSDVFVVKRAVACLVGRVAADYVSDVGQKGVPPNEIMVWWQSAARLHIVDLGDRQDDFLPFLLFFQKKLCLFCKRRAQGKQKRMEKRLLRPRALPKCIFHFR